MIDSIFKSLHPIFQNEDENLTFVQFLYKCLHTHELNYTQILAIEMSALENNFINDADTFHFLLWKMNIDEGQRI